MNQYTPALRPDILVVDDYTDALDVWAIMLGTAGFDVRTAATGPQALHQVKTTVNFARRNPVLCWFLGGLNFQIEHHLFPMICHVHYPAICRIVEQTCKDFGVKYAQHPTFWSGVASHYRWLKQMGQLDAKQGPHAGQIAANAFS